MVYMVAYCKKKSSFGLPRNKFSERKFLEFGSGRKPKLLFSWKRNKELNLVAYPH